MKEKTENFIYKHITKASWIVGGLWSLLAAFFFTKYPLTSFWYFAIRLFFFGLVWWLLFESFDYYATRFRTKVLCKSPELKRAIIQHRIEEIDELAETKK